MKQMKGINNGPSTVDQQLSYDSYDIYSPNDLLRSASPKQAIHTNHEGEKLESLLEMLDESKLNDKIFTAEERNMIIEDTQNLATQSGSETLIRPISANM